MKSVVPIFRSKLIAWLVFVGLCINGFLLTRTWSGPASAGSAGCGGGGCDGVLDSRWSTLLGLPIAGIGVCVYALLVISWFRRLEMLRLPLLGGIVAAALWFTVVQALILGKFCPWCTAAHGIGLTIVIASIFPGRTRTLRPIASWAALVLLAIIPLQVWGPAKPGYRLERVQSAMAGTQQGPRVSFNEGRLVYQIAEHPRIGPADAAHVLVEYFDYQCNTCQVMAGYLEALVAAHPGRVAVLLMPVPLESACNPLLGSTATRSGSCEITRITLAVWRARPQAFAAYHKRLIDQPSAASARRLALEVLTDDELAAALTDPWIEASITRNTRAWREFSTTSDKLPKLLIHEKRILHGLPPGEGEFLTVMRQELGL